MTQAERSALRRESDIKDYFLGSVLSGGGSAPPDKTAPGWAEMYDRYQSIALQTRLRIPLLYGVDAVHGHNNVVRGRHLPPQHRPRLHPQRGARRARRAGHGRGGRGDRHRLDVLALHRRRARRALGPHLRELRRDAGARLRDGRGRGARLSVGGHPRLPQALPRRRRHGGGPRPGRRPARRDHAASHPPARLPRGDRGRRRLGHGLVQQLERVRRCTATGTCSPTCSRASWASPASSSATGPASTSFPATTPPTSRARSTPASTW